MRSGLSILDERLYIACTLSSGVEGMSVVRLNSELVSWREVDGEILALDLGGSRYLSSNEAGAILWKALAGGSTAEALTDLLVQEFGIDAERARNDVDRFVDDLAAQGLLAA
jgi:hypothetical protein